MRNIIEWDVIESISRGKKGNSLKVVCPNCKDQRTNKSDRALSINMDKGLAKCHYCEAIAFRKDDSVKFQKTFTLPKQNWKNYTKLSDKIVKYLETERSIRQSTITELGVTQEKYYQPQLRSEVENLVFNYFELDVVVNKKYRDSNKNFTQSKNGKSIFYNLNSIIGKEEAFIVEGEFDVLAMHQCGYKNTISLPNGANDNDEFWINCKDYIKDVKKFYICTDNDHSGEIVSEKIAQRLGRYRCVRVLFEKKDANGQLIAGGDKSVKKSIEDAKHYKTQGTFTVEDMYENIVNLYDQGLPKVIFPKSSSFGDLKDVFSVMRGQLVVATGIPSHGKSNFVEWYVMNLIQDYKMKASFFSPEHHPLELHQSTFIEKFFGRSFWYDNHNCPRIKKEEIKEYKEWANEKLYTTSSENGDFPTWDWLLDVFKEQMFVYGIDIFVIDAFNKVEFNNTSKQELQNIKEVLTKLTMFAQMNNVIIFLVAHPKKMQKGLDDLIMQPDLYSISGSADFRNQAHAGFSIYRYFNDHDTPLGISYKKNDVVFRTEKVKMRYQGEISGEETYKFHIPSGRYYANNVEPLYRLDRNTLSDIHHNTAHKDVNNVKSITLEDAFGEKEEDIPF